MSDLRFSVTGSVLVVDDSESNRYVLATWLRRAGHLVIEAKTGREALDAIEKNHVDMVVLDVNLPDIPGFAVCEQIKSTPATRSIPVLHVSATATATSDRSEGLRRGADGYLIEPLEREELISTVEALLRGATAQRTATRLAQRLRRLNDATLAVNEADQFDQLIGTIAQEAGKLFDTTAIVAAMLDEGGLVAYVRPNEEPLLTSCTRATVDALRGVITQEELLRRLSTVTLRASELRGPLLAGDLSDSAHGGILLIEYPDAALDGAMADETEIVLNQFARAAGTAIHNMRTFDIERQIALTLQQSLLPDIIPVIAGIDVAVRYKASAAHAEVGGDFYEIFALDANRVVIAIGDVVGHSLEAAAVMVQLRTGIRSYMLEGHGPDAVIERLNRLLLRFHTEFTATVCVAIFDIANRRCELANAGHLPPLVADANGSRFLPNGGPLLGVEAEVQPAHVFRLAAGEVLLLFTDGLVERRNETIDDGLTRLATAAAAPSGGLEEMCDRLLRDVGPTNITDDIAIVAIRPNNAMIGR